jgi:hypothetical protein
MKKIELLTNETFTIKGSYGETYVFDGDDLFVDSSNVSRKAVVLKSLRTRTGAESWLASVGKSFSNAQIFDTNSLREFEGRVVTRKSIGSEDEAEDFDATMPFHVVATSDDEGGPQAESDGGPGQGHEELMEDEEQEQDMSMTQIAQILHDAEKLYDMISQEEHLEPWMQAKLTKVAEFVSAIAENLEHEDGEIPDEDDAQGGTMRGEDEGADDDDMMDEIVKSVLKNLAMKDASAGNDEPAPGTGDDEDAPAPGTGDDEYAPAPGTGDDEDAPAPVADWTGAGAGNGSGFEKSITGTIFKSLNSARQWNRFENPDKDRYYIDIMREKDVRKSFSKSSGLNAKYVVRDRWDDEEATIKGAHGNKLVKGSKILPEKRIDPATLRVAAIRKG